MDKKALYGSYANRTGRFVLVRCEGGFISFHLSYEFEGINLVNILVIFLGRNKSESVPIEQRIYF